MSPVKWFVHRLIGWFISLILPRSSVWLSENFELWQKHGYHVTPVHFYYPLPDTRELAQSYPAPSRMVGIEMREEAQLTLLKDVSHSYIAEYERLSREQNDDNRFFLGNDAFAGIDPFVYYGMLRYFRPRRVIEIGSGYSTLLAAETIAETGMDTVLTVVDPWPRPFMCDFVAQHQEIEYLEYKVETLGSAFFDRLQPNDFLFIDSSHVVHTGSDVVFLILEVLPLLRPGVIVHFHDIFLPFDYPIDWVVKFHLFWTEQYLLQAYLTNNRQVEILFANHFLSERYPEVMCTAFPNALRWDGGSFWFRRKPVKENKSE